MESLQGHLLIASPHLADPNFVRTVVLLVHHSEEGTLGVVLNRPSGSTIRKLWEDVEEEPCDSEHPFHLGGPVSGPVMALHTDANRSELEIIPGLHFAARRDHIDYLVRRNEDPFRIFVGHSGWGKGQLESEMEEGAWFTLPATLDLVFGDESEIWQRAAHQVGREMLFDALKIQGEPEDPTWN
ncbi:MAG: YqgE/AlgH family protein [Planctomycetaceae bacterium]|nr:YqgE/AlgH family protein [Planctomycetaceae bacterium]